MTSFFASTATYDREIADPDTGDVMTVTFRELNAGDAAMIRDSIRVRIGDSGTEVDVPAGTTQLLFLERAIVKWSLDVSPTPNVLKTLKPEVLQALTDAANAGPGDSEPDPLAETNG